MTWRSISAWPDPSALVDALGVDVVKQRAVKGEGEAQFTMGCVVVRRSDEAGRGRQIARGGCRVGTFHLLASPHSLAEALRCDHLTK